MRTKRFIIISTLLTALLAAPFTLAGLLLAFWMQPRSVLAVREEGGWIVSGQSRKGGALFREEFLKAAAAAGFEPCAEEKEGEDA